MNTDNNRKTTGISRDKTHATQSPKARIARSPKIDVPLMERAAISPNEMAALFGRQSVWAYRQIYAGKVKVVTTIGRIMIPIGEVKRLLGTAAEYTGTTEPLAGQQGA